MILKFNGNVKNGRFIPDNLERFKQAFISLENLHATVTVSRYRKPRSDRENRYYWGVIIKMLAEEFGSNKDGVEASDWWHEFLKTKFLKEIRYKKFKNKQLRLVRVKSTTELSTVEAEKYYEDIRRWAATELQFYLPLPGETL